ncbi:MAG: hypothetical protein WCT32_03015 [Patescibacteria group bacterium]|jgi:hypothetical protein
MKNIVRITALLAACLFALGGAGCSAFEKILDYDAEIRSIDMLDGSTLKVRYRPKESQCYAKGYALVPPHNGYGPRQFDLGFKIMGSVDSGEGIARITFGFDYFGYLPAEVAPDVAYYFHVEVIKPGDPNDPDNRDAKYFRYYNGVITYDPPNMDRSRLAFTR